MKTFMNEEKETNIKQQKVTFYTKQPVQTVTQ